ncbi:MAG TPA: diphthine--ammonia ligase [Methanoregulaceae archaeon]|nr:diphthine--ammonia ligase [Methanoregulaceae archaeon]
MGYAALTSGGKDSILSIQKAMDRGMDVTHLVTVRPANPDSFMFHSSNLDVVPVIARLSGLDYVEVLTEGEKEKELEDLALGLSSLDIEGVVVGAINSVYQRDRVLAIAKDLGIEVFAPLWLMDPEVLLQEVATRMDAIIVVTAADGLGEEMLGAHIDDAFITRLKQISARKHIHLAGEGGEYESMTLFAPFYSRPVRFTSKQIVPHGAGRYEMILGGIS